ncbi:MAG: TVP38/TMEM64 family protein, partial [Thermoleophilaceae bacterium]|nr:TVP38/TMEM64 family protein [Thermoleophilaceae bacterium]
MDPYRRLAYIRIGVFGAFVVALFVAATLSGSLPNAKKIQDWGESLGPAAPLLYIPLSAVLS